jgi:hypothetical protein
MAVLVIGKDELDRINAAVARARARPIPWDVLKAAMPGNQNTRTLTLADRAPVESARPQSEMVDLPIGFRLAVSFEHQPVGLCMHLSMSVNRPGKLPNPAAVAMVCEACLKATPHSRDHIGREWIEEFLVDGEPGGLAINVLYLIAPAQAGHA